jgi:hypothetical protein
MATDSIMTSWLARQKADADDLNASSDVVNVLAIDHSHFLAHFRCKGLVKAPSGAIEICESFLVGIAFNLDFLRRFDPTQTLSILEPSHVVHPNIYQSAICLGRQSPGTDLVSLLDQTMALISYKHMNLRDPLNADAAAWARDQKQFAFPLDKRPLKRRPIDPLAEACALS